MALELKFNINKNTACDTFTFTQTTGPEDITNPTGWMDNVLSDYQDSYITIKNITENVIYNLIEIVPSDIVGHESDIIYADLIIQNTNNGIGVVKIADGVYSFTHTVLLEDNQLINTTNYFMSLCSIECKLKLLSIQYINYSSECSPCENKLLNLFVEAMALYDILKFSFKCGNFKDFNTILTNLQELLTTLDCKNC